VSIDRQQSGVTMHTNFEYDADGRITKITLQDNTSPKVTLYDITYQGSAIRMAQPMYNSAGNTRTDTIHLFLDIQGHLVKRIKKEFNEYFPPSNDPQRTYSLDTTVFEYNGLNLLVKENINGWDSTWRNVSNSGTINTSLTRTSGSNTYTLNNGRLTSMNGIMNWSFVTKQGVQTVSSSRSTESHYTYEYAQSYKNQTDFSNKAILNEIRNFNGLPFNEYYSNVPDKLTTSLVDKDQNGSIISTYNSTSNMTYTYNSNGYIISMFDPATPDQKTTFVYNK